MSEEAARDGNNANSENLGAELAEMLELQPVEQPVIQETEEETAEGAVEEAVETSGGEIKTITELAAELDVEPSTLYGLELPMPDGTSVTIGEFKDRMQGTDTLAAERANFAKEKAQALEEVAALKTKANDSLQYMQAVPEALMKARADIEALQLQAQSTDWAGLEKDNPGQAALLKQKFQEAMGVLQGRQNGLQQEYKKAQGEYQQKAMAEARAKAIDLIPEWKDSSGAVNLEAIKADHQGVIDMVQGYGFKPEEVNAINDPRMVKFLRDVMVERKQLADATKNATQVIKRGNPRLSAGMFGKRSGNAFKQTIERGKQTGSSKAEKFAAQKAILESAGAI